MKKIKNILFKVIVLSSLYTLIYTSLQSEELKIYSERQPLLIEPLLKEFEKDTGIKVEWIYSKKGLVQKIILEKNRPVADIFLSSDISRLIDIAEADASVKMQPLSMVPENLQSDYWAGLTQRARIIYVNKELGVKNVFFKHADGGLGWNEQSPFDRIIVTANAPEIPSKLVEQLVNDGIMIIPVGDDYNQQILKKVVKKGNKILVENLMQVRFVPLIEGKLNK